MHSQWTRIHCSDGRWRETPKALYYNHLPAAYLTFASPSVFVFLFVLKPAFEFLICNFNFNTISSLFFCIWVGLLFTFEVVLQPFVQFVLHFHPIWFDFKFYLIFYFNYLPVAAYVSWNHSTCVPVTVSEELFHPREWRKDFNVYFIFYFNYLPVAAYLETIQITSQW